MGHIRGSLTSNFLKRRMDLYPLGPSPLHQLPKMRRTLLTGQGIGVYGYEGDQALILSRKVAGPAIELSEQGWGR